MKNLYYLIILFFSCEICEAQVLCIYCYDQNDTISANVNNLISNGGFENGCGLNGYYCPNSSLFNCNITDWICIGGGNNTWANVVGSNTTAIVEGIKAIEFSNDYCVACSPINDDTFCIINTACTVSGVPFGYPTNNFPGYGGDSGVILQQTVNGLIVGNTYVLEFWAGGRFQVVSPGPGLFAVDVGFGDTLMRNKPVYLLGTIKPDTIGTRYIIEFNASASSHTIKFTNWGHICSHCTELILDDVRLYTLAELDVSVPHCTVGIKDAEVQNEVTILPNPVINELNIKSNRTEVLEITLYDLTSRILLQQTFTNTTTINTAQLASGIYLYQVRNKNGVIKNGKVVKD